MRRSLLVPVILLAACGSAAPVGGRGAEADSRSSRVAAAEDDDCSVERVQGVMTHFDGVRRWITAEARDSDARPGRGSVSGEVREGRDVASALSSFALPLRWRSMVMGAAIDDVVAPTFGTVLVVDTRAPGPASR